MFLLRLSFKNSLINVSKLRLNCSSVCNCYHSSENWSHLLQSKNLANISSSTINLVNQIRLSSNLSDESSDNRLKVINLDNHKGYDGEEGGSSDNQSPLLAAGFVSGLLSFLGWDDLLSKEDPFILTIKRGILCMQREEFDKAEIILHAALTNAVTLKDEKAIIYIYSLLGNTAFLKGDLEKSETIYKDLIKRLLKQNIEEDHEAMIEISVKLATIYSKLGKFSKADVGFSHCIDIQKKRIAKMEIEDKLIVKEGEPGLTADQINSYALYGMVLDFYGKHLLRKQEFEGALRYTLDALKICEKVNGVNAHQTMVLLSDAGTLLNLVNHFDEADNYFQRAIKIATIIESDHLKTLYYNIGMNNLMRRNYSQAQTNCDTSYRYAHKDDDKTIMGMAQDCLKKVKAQLA